MLVGRAFTLFSDLELAAPETFIPACENDPIAIYELPLLAGRGFPVNPLLPTLARGYVVAPEFPPFEQPFPGRDPNVRSKGAQGSAHKGAHNSAPKGNGALLLNGEWVRLYDQSRSLC